MRYITLQSYNKKGDKIGGIKLDLLHLNITLYIVT